MKRVLWLLVLLLASPVGAKTLCVNGSTGSDATTYAANNGTSTCWQTIGRAAWGSTNFSAPSTSQAAQAGDTVYVAAGTYSNAASSDYVGASSSRFTPVYLPANSGSSGSPITFEAVGTVILTTTSGAGAVVGALNQSYITWRGFTINEANAPSNMDTGPVVVWSSDHVTIDLLTITCDSTYFPADNHTGIRIENSQSVTVSNTTASYCRNSGSPASTNPTYNNPDNGTCIETYTSGNLTITHNEFHHCGSGIFLKANGGGGSGGPVSVTLNYVHDNEQTGIHFYNRFNDSARYTATQNVIVDNPIGTSFHRFDGSSTDIKLVDFVNNTIIGGTYGFYSQIINASSDHRFLNNIIYGTATQCVWNEGATAANMADTARITLNRNLYNTCGVRVARIDSSGSYAALSDWQTAISQEANSSNGAPSFTGGSGAAAYKLSGGSAALTLGVDTLDIDADANTSETIPSGAYITGSETIGPTASGGSSSSGGGGLIRARFGPG